MCAADALAHNPAMKEPRRSARLSWKDVGLVAQALVLAPRVLKSVTRQITTEYRLGPHGAWILRLIGNGQVVYPLDVTQYFHIGRSIISDELARLTRARLIGYRQSRADGRRVELTLTPLGKRVALQIRRELMRFVIGRFAGYSRADVLKFTRMLYGFVLLDPASSGAVFEARGPKR
jgi:DNA-binding MarR family transcriptional regulator